VNILCGLKLHQWYLARSWRSISTHGGKISVREFCCERCGKRKIRTAVRR